MFGLRQYAYCMDQNIAAVNDPQYQAQACRTLPISETITAVAGYPAKLKIYLTRASQYWQARCFFKGRVYTRSMRTTNKREASNHAKCFYESLLARHYVQHTQSPIVMQSDARLFETLAEQVIVLQRERVLRGEVVEMTYRSHVNRLRRYWVPQLGKHQIDAITQQDIVLAVSALAKRGISPISTAQYLQSLRCVFKYAYEEQLITRIPAFPKLRKTSVPRGGFTVLEYRVLVTTAKQLSNVREPCAVTTHRNRANSIFVKSVGIPKEIVWLIGFMVNGFMRPSDVIHIKHQHVEIVRGEHLYLRLTLPETKRHRAQIVTLTPAVRNYQQLYAYMDRQGLAAPDDYLFLPGIRRRSSAGVLMSQHFIKVLDAAGLRTGPLGQARTLYSLRHTSIMFRLLYGRGIDLLTLARNARTSVQMVEKFYASNLTAEMNIGLLQSRRT